MGLLKSLPPRATKQSDAAAVSKASKAKTVGPTIKGGGGKSIFDSISSIVALVETKLGKYKELYTLLRTEEDVRKYFDDIIAQGIGSLDTETDSLDPITCTIAGVCLYAPGLKPAYIPMNHVSYVTGARSSNQIDKHVVAECLEKCTKAGVKWIMHGAKFDTRVCHHQLGVNITAYWCTYLAARCINNTEMSNELKELHIKYCNSQDDVAWTFSKLFEGLPFTKIPITTGYLYAAGDPFKTFELYEYQKTVLSRRNLPGPYRVFMEVEMPLIPAVAAMEDAGVCLDLPFAKILSIKYNKELVEREAKFNEVCSQYNDKIRAFITQNSELGHKLSNPINVNSPTQLAILLYDILGYKSPDKKKPRGTGEEIIETFDGPLPKAILDYRETAKLLSTYVDKMPNVLNSKTGRIHASFNQYGADTGRFSSSDPNLQNIPSHNKEIRKMFKATDGYVLISCDFSQQEPRTLAHMSQDATLIATYQAGKDIYAWIAASIYKVDYDLCKEKFPDGTLNPEGKKRRDSVKSIILGIMYGRQAKAIAEQIGTTTKKAQEIIDKFFLQFPTVKQWMDGIVDFARKHGYVETAWGRRRYLPDMQLPEYSFSYDKEKTVENFDPLDFDNVSEVVVEVPKEIQEYFIRKLKKCFKWSDKNKIYEEAKARGIRIRDNTFIIAEAERQCVNTVIQGSSADMTKKAMIAINKDEELSRLGWRTLIQVHDELIGECPEENRAAASAKVCELMVEAAREKITVPMKCDAEITYVWYGEEVAA